MENFKKHEKIIHGCWFGKMSSMKFDSTGGYVKTTVNENRFALVVKLRKTH
jgi:hypothetical protein